ncbi:MAG: VWA domain-containing protein [Candidatus Korobacteraceae bacterium]|jgi:Ca-activated chloride channel family protein
MPVRLALSLLLVLLTPALAQDAPAKPPDLSPPDMSKVPWSPVRRNPAPAQSPQPSATISVNVKLVNVFASVVDADGAPYAALQKEDFLIYEDGIEQKLSVFERESGLPLSVAIALDTSMSTRKDLPLEIASARKFVHTLLRPVDSISLYQFSTYVSQALPYTNDERRLDDALNHLRTGAATALYDAIFLSAQSLQRRQGRKIIVLITDGGDTSSKTDYPEALRAAQIAEAIIYSIIMVPIEADAGRDTGGEHALIQLSRDTGGKYYYATSLPQLDEAFRQIGNELRTQYLLAYYPISRRGDEFRRITVELTAEAQKRAHRELYVRHRAGYYNSKID